MTVHHHEPQGLFDAALAAVLRRAAQAFLKPILSPTVTIERQRRRLDDVARLTPPPRGARFEPGTLGGAAGSVSGEWVRLASAPRLPGTLLYLHGGAYCIGSAATHRNLTAQLARRTGMAVFALNYRLAPEHRFPAAVEDALAACRALRERGPLVIAGDSAGGGLALATAIALRDACEPAPVALVLISPWVDMGTGAMPAVEPPGEAMLNLPWAGACAELVLGGADPRHPWASPLFADLRGLPPTLIQAGTDELLHDQALRLHDALEAAGVPVRCEITNRRWHVFQASAGQLPSATEAVQRAAGFVAQRVVHAVRADSRSRGEVEQREVVILGAGMSGLCMGIQLKKAGIEDFVILEKSEGLGGTWWDNRYPGAHVDVPAPLYSFSFEPNPRWRRRFAAAPEIQAYMAHCADKYGLHPQLRFGAGIRDASFDETRARWLVTLASGERLDARFFVCSTGPLNQARWPDIPGLESFAGTRLHSAMWNPDVPLQGRRVAVIGTGSTASQLVPPVAEAAAHLTVFQRTANWVLPRLDRPYHRVDRWLTELPLVNRLVRGFWYLMLEWSRRGFDEGTLARRTLLGLARRHLHAHVADESLRAKLRPLYPLGCKRLVYSNDYYDALVRPNVTLETAAIRAVTSRGVVTVDGREHEFDVLVCATGFDTTHPLSSLCVRGAGGRLLSQAWADGPSAYRGVTVAGFPNLFLMLGPNTGTGHTSTLLYIEPQVQFAIAAMQRVRAQGAGTIDVRPEVFERHNAQLQARLQGSVWSHCRSWYRTDSGKITALWPGFTKEYVTGLTRERWDDYVLR